MKVETGPISREQVVEGRKAQGASGVMPTKCGGGTCVTAAEHEQLLVGNRLLQQALALSPLSVRYKAGALLVHPAFPHWSNNAAQVASIWRIDEGRRLLRVPGIRVIDIQQQWLGQDAVQPTSLMFCGLSLLSHLIIPSTSRRALAA